MSIWKSFRCHSICTSTSLHSWLSCTLHIHLQLSRGSSARQRWYMRSFTPLQIHVLKKTYSSSRVGLFARSGDIDVDCSQLAEFHTIHLQYWSTYLSKYPYVRLLNTVDSRISHIPPDFDRCVVKALWNALRGRHKYGATSRNQYAARRCSMITRLTRNSDWHGFESTGEQQFLLSTDITKINKVTEMKAIN